MRVQQEDLVPLTKASLVAEVLLAICFPQGLVVAQAPLEHRRPVAPMVLPKMAELAFHRLSQGLLHLELEEEAQAAAFKAQQQGREETAAAAQGLRLDRQQQALSTAVAVAVELIRALLLPVVPASSSCVTPTFIQSPTPAAVLHLPPQQMAAIKSLHLLPALAMFPGVNHGTLRIS
jgi:hypothetical protein